MKSLRKITKKRVMIALSFLMVMGIGLSAPDQSEAFFASPSQGSIYGEIDWDLANELYGCPYGNTMGVTPILLETFNGWVSPNTKDQVTYIDHKCVKCWLTDASDGIDANEDPNPLCGEPISEETIRNEYLPGLLVSQGPGLNGMLTIAQDKLLEQRPASGVVFALDHVDRLITPDSVYAQAQAYFPGTGFDLLAPIQAFWGWAVTISYSFMIIIVIFVALAMVFRQQLGGQTVVQIQSAIPSIILAMILIPLSYPISGLFIDGITLGTNIFHDFMFGPAGPGSVVLEQGEMYDTKFSEGRQLYADDYRLSSIRAYELIGIQKVGEIFADRCNVVDENGSTAYAYGDDCPANTFTDNAVYSLIDSVLGVFGSNIPTIIGSLINGIFALFALVVGIRVTIRLIKALLYLMVYPIFSPFIMATAAFPGQGNKLIMGYLKTMGYAALTYIITYAMFITSIVFTNDNFAQTIPNASATSYSPPMLADLFSGFISDAAGAGGNIQILFTILGAAVFLAIPSVLDAVKKQLVPEGSGFLKTFTDDVMANRRLGLAGLSTGAATGAAGVRSVYRGGRGLVRGGTGAINTGLRLAGRETLGERAQRGVALRQARSAQRLDSAREKFDDAKGLGKVMAGARLAATAGTNQLSRVRNVGSGGAPEFQEGEGFLNAAVFESDGESKTNILSMSEEHGNFKPYVLKISSPSNLTKSSVEVDTGGGFVKITPGMTLLKFKSNGKVVAALQVSSYEDIKGGKKEHSIGVTLRKFSQQFNQMNVSALGEPDPDKGFKLKVMGLVVNGGKGIAIKMKKVRRAQ